MLTKVKTAPTTQPSKIIPALSAVPIVRMALTISSSSAMLVDCLKVFFVGFGVSHGKLGRNYSVQAHKYLGEYLVYFTA